MRPDRLSRNRPGLRTPDPPVLLATAEARQIAVRTSTSTRAKAPVVRLWAKPHTAVRSLARHVMAATCTPRVNVGVRESLVAPGNDPVPHEIWSWSSVSSSWGFESLVARASRRLRWLVAGRDTACSRRERRAARHPVTRRPAGLATGRVPARPGSRCSPDTHAVRRRAAEPGWVAVVRRRAAGLSGQKRFVLSLIRNDVLDKTTVG